MKRKLRTTLGLKPLRCANVDRPAVAYAGTIYVGRFPGDLYALDGQNDNAELEWYFEAETRLYFGSGDGKLYAFSSEPEGLPDSDRPTFGRDLARIGRFAD